MLSHDVDQKPHTGVFFVPKELSEPNIPLNFQDFRAIWSNERR